MGRVRFVLLAPAAAICAICALSAESACDSRPVHSLDDDDAGAEAGDEADVTPPPPPVELGRHAVTVTDTRKIVPSAGLPPDAPVNQSNNNLDVVRYENRVWLVWRTAPDHFASTETKMVIVSSDDETTWKLEKVFAIGTDLREPRFLVFGTDLLVHFAILGADPSKFQPQGVRYSKRNADGTWTDLAETQRLAPDGAAPAPMVGYIAWRTKSERGKPYMSTYLGGEHIYTFDGLPLDVNLLTTTDGVTWQGVNPEKPVVSHGGGSEMDFTLGDDGTLFAVIRNEEGDETGLGSKICRAAGGDAGDLSTWTCKTDKRKYDSPLMFWHDGEAYLVGRRNVTATGNYDIDKPAENLIQTSIQYQIDYRIHPKRCSLWRYVQGEDRIAFILDLPSRGDTCFASRLDGATPDELVVYDYSSAIEGPDIDWVEGQSEPTYIYRHVLRFAPR